MMIEKLLTIPGDSDFQRRGRTVVIVATVLFCLNFVRTAIAFMAGASAGQVLPGTMIGIFGTLIPIGLARRGQVTLAGWVLILMALSIVSSLPLLRGELVLPVFFLTMPVVLAGMILRPWQVWLVVALALSVLALLVRVTGNSEWHRGQTPVVLTLMGLILAMGILHFIGARVNAAVLAGAATARRDAETAAAELEVLNANLESEVAKRTSDLRTALHDVETRAAEQARLLHEIDSQRVTIREMSVPILPLNHDMLVLPLVGVLDSHRLCDLQQRALEALEGGRARKLLLDITGVPIVDSQVAAGLLQTVQAARLLGAEVVLIGVRPEVAQALVALGIDMGGLRAEADLENALRFA
jgi:rsbT co-antagonist protein RsbR